MSIISRLFPRRAADPEAKRRLADLHQAEAKLAELRRSYVAGTFSGHPEDILWDIDDAELRVKTLKNAL